MKMERYAALGRKPDEEAMERARKKWNAIAKPLHSLGKLENAIVRIAGIQRSEDVHISERAVLVFCGDNGVVAQGVAQASSHVTAVVADNIAEGRASVNRMCGKCATDVFAIDMGMLYETHSSHIISKKIAAGTRDFSVEPAMSIEQAKQAIDTGIALVKEYREKGYRLLATGEMGIGNTTSSSAIAAALLGLSAEEAVGRGAGLSREGLVRKKVVVQSALERYRLSEKSALEVLAYVGGFDIAGMAGAFIGGCIYGVPIMIDGMISAVAALVASKLCPVATGSMLASHMGREPCMEAVMEELGLSPIIYGSLGLGEGTGAALLFPMLDMAESVYRSMETFEKNKIVNYEDFEDM